jgi:riboflavin biosynthesis pyrimidine reductase
LAHVEPRGAAIDWQLLQTGWATCDAVFGTSAILRDEPNVLFTPKLASLLVHREKLGLKKYPIQVILTGTGNVPSSHLIFLHEELQVVIITTKSGKALLEKQTWKANIAIEDCSVPGRDDCVSYSDALRLLRSKYDVRTVDLTAGGETFSGFIYEKLIDEV